MEDVVFQKRIAVIMKQNVLNPPIEAEIGVVGPQVGDDDESAVACFGMVEVGKDVGVVAV